MSQEGVRYELVEVTADVAVRARGRTVGELLANAAWGMFDLICDTATVEAVRTWEVEASAPDAEGLMVDLLTELLVLFETEGMVAASVEVEVVEGGPPLTAVARVSGEALDTGRHELLHDIKAVTWHTLAVRPEEGWAQVLFDI